MINFHVKITLPEAPNDNLAEKISFAGFISSANEPQHSQSELNQIRQQLTDYLVSAGIITAARRDDLVFDFE